MIKEFIQESLDNFDLLSLDLFDTMLLRPFLNLADLFLTLADDEFLYKRIFAERICACQFGDGATIDDIYNNMPEKYKHIKDKEIEAEKI